TLRQMEKDGVVTKYTGEGSKGPEKSVYAITEKGRDMLIKWLKVQNDKEYVKYEILLKLFFGSMVSFGDNLKRVGDFKERYENVVKMIQLYKENLEKVMNDGEDHFYYYLTVLFGEHIYRAYIDWADEAEKLLEAHMKNNK
ncbi:MAG TPA: PadR family transcriptional regulator, partial [Ruminiclostridium sp.]|nr:PadR family transcriptional regulator [Ruminiclostridium sp.]